MKASCVDCAETKEILKETGQCISCANEDEAKDPLGLELGREDWYDYQEMLEAYDEYVEDKMRLYRREQKAQREEEGYVLG